MKHLPELSCYNNNVYELQNELPSGLSHFIERAIDDEYYSICELGTIFTGSFLGSEIYFEVPFEQELTEEFVQSVKLETKYIWT